MTSEANSVSLNLSLFMRFIGVAFLELLSRMLDLVVLRVLPVIGSIPGKPFLSVTLISEPICLVSISKLVDVRLLLFLFYLGCCPYRPDFVSTNEYSPSESSISSNPYFDGIATVAFFSLFLGVIYCGSGMISVCSLSESGSCSPSISFESTNESLFGVVFLYDRCGD